jgi:hypothetical protein
MPAPTLVSSDLVFVEWITTIAGLTADGVATQLPADESTWAVNGFIVVPTTVGGSPHESIPVRRPVGQVECWATNAGSDRLPWGRANLLADQVRMGTYDRLNFNRPLQITRGTVTYPGAVAKRAQMMSEPRRVWSDVGDYAGFVFDLLLEWVQTGETIP